MRRWLGTLLNIILIIEIIYLFGWVIPEYKAIYQECDLKVLCAYGSIDKRNCDQLLYPNFTIPNLTNN